MKIRRFIKKRRQRALKRYHDLANALRSQTEPDGQGGYRLRLLSLGADLASTGDVGPRLRAEHQ